MNSFSDVPILLQEVFRCAQTMRDVAYCPYSGFKVGAALLTTDGKIYTGCNIENASYSLTICAERTALVKAISDRKKNFSLIAISSSSEDGIVYPCGACRQMLCEFGRNLDVYLLTNDDRWKKHRLEELLPFAFNDDVLLSNPKTEKDSQ